MKSILNPFQAISIHVRFVSSTPRAIPGIRVSPYTLFVKENYDKFKDAESFVESSRKVADAWKRLGNKERSVYMDRAKVLKEEKVREFKNLSESEQKSIVSEAIDARKEKIKRKVRKERREHWENTGHPIRPPTAFIAFTKEQFELLKKENKPVSPVSSILIDIAKKWKNLSSTEKEVYAKMIEADWKRYKEDVSKWEEKMKVPESNKKGKSKPNKTKD